MKNELHNRQKELIQQLKQQINPSGYWDGELSSSALAVAVAITAFHFHDAEEYRPRIIRGVDWLLNNINEDGSFGDTPDSPGNISTTLLVFAAFNLFKEEREDVRAAHNFMASYLMSRNIDVKTGNVAGNILAHYKKDYTFSVPILTMSALCGVGGKNPFKKIPQLPFELALLPRNFYRFLNLSVVSYAIPALIAVGIVIHKHKKTGLTGRLIRKTSTCKALQQLESMLPESGGFLEAIPLTAFVALSLIKAGHNDHPAVVKGTEFLKRTQREDGSWPIDVNLSTWVTTLSVKSLRSNIDSALSEDERRSIARHLLSIQNMQVHPFNGTSPGGWGWTSYSGSVPDGDDSSGVILSLLKLLPLDEAKEPVKAGIDWLMQLQNSDGGIPTFSRGWGKLPFDQSCADLTGHFVLSMSAFMEFLPGERTTKHYKVFSKAVDYLQKHQHAEGSWLPLWFGSQYTTDNANPVYGTARVVTYLKEVLTHKWHAPEMRLSIKSLVDKGTGFLLNNQNEDGSWGGRFAIPGTIEETSLALSAIVSPANNEQCSKALAWLDKFYALNGVKASPIGLYFASLWYDEKLYPLTSYLEAVTRMVEMENDRHCYLEKK